jgi:FAD/FMN-containing dehydrogenase
MQHRDLASDLASAVRGEVRFDDGSRGLDGHDASLYRQIPIGVVVPRDAEDVARPLEVCRGHDVPIFGRGCGTSLAGQCCNAGVVFDFSKYMHGVVALEGLVGAHGARARAGGLHRSRRSPPGTSGRCSTTTRSSAGIPGP